MSLHVEYRGRRVSVAASSNTPLASVLNSACGQLRLDPSAFALHYRRSRLDLSKTLSVCHLPNNATLELKAAGSGARGAQIRVALKLDTGGPRMTSSCSASDTLASLLRKVLAESGAAPSEAQIAQASLTFMRQRYEAAALADTTLASIGVREGSAMFTVHMPPPDAAAASAAAAPAPAEPAEKSSEPTQPTAPAAAPEPRGSAPAAAESAPAPRWRPNRLPVPPPAAEPMDVDVPTSAGAGGAAAAAGVEGCRAALDLLLSSNFDAASRDALRVLSKYVYNLLSRPSDERCRRINCANATFRGKVLAAEGALAFLLALGFERRPAARQDAAGPFISAAEAPQMPFPSADEALQMPQTAASDVATLRGAYALLAERAAALDLAVRAAPEAAPQAIAFDPYRSMSTSMAPRLQSGRKGPSVTAQRLSALEAKRDAMLEELSPGRGLVVLAPGEERMPSAAEGASGGDEGAVVASAVAQMVQKRQKQEATPFTTRAVREVERLERKKSYAYVLLRLVLPDRWALQAKFLPHETIADVRAFLEDKVAPSERLCISEPPRGAFEDARSLRELGLVPAARLFVTSPAGAPALAQRLRDGAGTREEARRHYPEGVRLGGAAQDTAEAKAGGPRPAAGATERKRAGASAKPKWMRI